MPLWTGIAILTAALWLFVSLVLKPFKEDPPESSNTLPSPHEGKAKENPREVFAEGELEEETEQLLTEALSGPGFADEDFLGTDYEPLSKWLEERFEMDYRAMTPDLIFDQVPLNDIFYEVGEMTGTDEPFEFRSSDISRRDLLREIAKHWDLKLELVLGEDGNPTAVSVERR